MQSGGNILGAIIAGGRARRFGSDKGAALLHAKPLINHIADALRPQVDHLVMVGRIWDGLESVADDPSPDLGPLGGLNAALKYALNRGYIGVLTSGCDTLPVPDNLRNLLGNAPAVIQNHYLFGYWPSTLSMALDTHVRTATNHSMRRWLSVSGALEIMVPRKFYNLNTPEDLDNYQTKS